MTGQAAGAAADIFISYARGDAAFAERLRKGIEGGGFSVWMDTASMAGGERWTKEIESAIEDATSVVVVVSASSNESVWVRREVLYAQQLRKRVVPVLAGQVALPVHLINLNALTLHEDFEVGLDRLLNTLRGQPAGAIAAAGKTTPPIHMGKVLWLFAGAAVVLVLAVIAAQGKGIIAEVLGIGLLIGSVLLGVAWKADDAISLEFRRDLGLWLDGMDPAAVGRSMQRWPAHFAALFDRVFGKKHLSWRCFFRSSIASLLAFLLCILIFMQVAPGEWTAFRSYGVVGMPENWVEMWAIWSPVQREVAMSMVLLSVGAMTNLLPDYVSLLETRWVIHRMQRTLSFSGQLGWLLVDFIATTAIFFLLIGGLDYILSGILHDNWEVSVESFVQYLKDFVQLSLLAPHGNPSMRVMAIPIWTTYFTTLWVWLYFLAQFLMRLATPLRRTLGFLSYALPVEQRPLRAVGQVMALVACLAYCLVMMLSASTVGGGATIDYLEPDMVPIQSGEFQMGCVSGKNCYNTELPVHRVIFDKRFAIGKYEVTFEEYDLFAKATDRARPDDNGFGRRDHPVINVSWEDARDYAAWLSKKTGKRYRLPTEAEWEYAARANTETQYWWGDEINKNQANCKSCGSEWDDKQAAPVGSFDPNPWRLYDTSGNVFEWVQDCWHDDYSGSPPTDGSTWGEKGDGECSERVIRGGSWNFEPSTLRSATRYGGPTDSRYGSLVGFRLAQDC